MVKLSSLFSFFILSLRGIKKFLRFCSSNSDIKRLQIVFGGCLRTTIVSATVCNWELEDPIVGIGSEVFLQGFSGVSNSEIFRSLKTVVELPIFSFSEIEKLVPMVEPGSNFAIVVCECTFEGVDRLHLGVELWVLHVEWPKD